MVSQINSREKIQKCMLLSKFFMSRHTKKKEVSGLQGLGKVTLPGRFQEVTLEALLNKGATHFAWLRPKDRVNGEPPKRHGNHGLSQQGLKNFLWQRTPFAVLQNTRDVEDMLLDL